MKITFNISDHFVREFIKDSTNFLINKHHSYTRGKAIRSKNKIKNIQNEWVSHYLKKYEELLITLKLDVKKVGILKYNLYQIDTIVGCVSKLPFSKKYILHKIDINAISKTLLDKLLIDISDTGIVSLRTADSKFISSIFMGYEYSKSDDLLTIYTSTGNYKFSVRRLEGVITYILGVLKLKLENSEHTHERYKNNA